MNLEPPPLVKMWYRVYNRYMVKLTLEYWEDGGWYVGRLVEVPGVISQGKSLESLRENILDAYRLMRRESPKIHRPTKRTLIPVPA